MAHWWGKLQSSYHIILMKPNLDSIILSCCSRHWGLLLLSSGFLNRCLDSTLTLWCQTLLIDNVHCDAQSTRGDQYILVNYACSCKALLCVFLPTSNLNNGDSAQQNGKGGSLFSIFPPGPWIGFCNILQCQLSTGMPSYLKYVPVVTYIGVRY